ncbi:sulfite exporter TauE/SafE family protein [Silvibacterium sp.]|uniref:sulfite exporter TauE/SafE family protein n=1 Tax=Silvibacterium sp. TaxID=1964179 RepID=UPI0039E409DA
MLPSLHETPFQVGLLASAGLIGGGLNALAGGGSFVSFPALLFCNVSPISANATNSLATWPGLLSAFWGYRERLRPHWRSLLLVSLMSILGGTAGGLLVLFTPPRLFSHLIPYLLLAGTVLFLFSLFRRGSSTAAEIAVDEAHRMLPQKTIDARSAAQLAVSLYGGYFAGGAGILQIAALSMFGIEDVQFILGLKNLFGVLMSGASLITLMIGGKISWPEAIILTVGSIAGGYLGGRMAQRTNPRVMRIAVATLCCVVTIVFFLKHR